MPYGSPVDPVPDTVITVAYAVANLLDPIRALRALTGNGDPPGSNYIVQSSTTSATTWQERGAFVLAALGFTPANKAGDTMTGPLGVPSLNASGAVSGASVSAGAGGLAVTGPATFNEDIVLGGGDQISFASENGLKINLTNTPGEYGLELATARMVLNTNRYVSLHNVAAAAGDYSATFDTQTHDVTMRGVTTAARFVSNVAAGASPFVATSPTICPNLNADLLDGMHAFEIIDSASAGGVPSGVIAMWLASMTAPAGWVIETNLYNVIAAGVNATQNGTYGALGSVGGVASHGHDLSNHAHDYNHSHAVNAHAHTADHGHGASSGNNSNAGQSGGTGTNRADDPHTHPITVSSTSGLSTSSVGGATANLGTSPVNTGAPNTNATNAVSNLPPYKAVLYIRKS